MKTHWLVLLLLGVCAVKASADRDIVYSARYYAPPGSHRVSRFHIYRINPDGTGKTQITSGSADEYAPTWSADGRRVTFLEYAGAGRGVVCDMTADGGRRRALRTLTGDSGLAPPPVPGYRLENDETDSSGTTYRHILINLRTGRRLTLNVPEHDDPSDALLPAPGQALVYATNDYDSTIGTNFLFYSLLPGTGALRYLTEGQFLAWSPDGSRFCVARGRSTASYEKRRQPYALERDASKQDRDDAEYRQVWVAPLYIQAAGGPMRQLTPNLSYVTGADWRKVE